MLDVKEAAQRASEYFSALYQNQQVENIQLEEVEITDDDQYWLITLSFPVKSDLANVFTFKRQYKIFKIDSKTGEVKSMKIRKVE
jgi:hypothetical protein